MKDNELWYGYLEAGAKGSAVIVDRSLDTGNPRTLYLFNLKRGQFLEYSREIVEPKLRELNAEEDGLVEDLKTAHKEARAAFRPRRTRALNIPDHAPAPPRKPEEDEAQEELEESFGEDLEPDLEADVEADVSEDEEEWEEDK